MIPLRSLMLVALASAGLAQQAGSVYREHRLTMQDNEWRVTDPDAGHEGAAKFLPNPKLEFEIDDLAGAAKAEVLIDRWGGHPGTIDKRVRFNGHEWLELPELETTPEGHRPECYMSQDNPVIAVPLDHLRGGVNVMEGTCGDQVCYSFRWGQWGQNAAIVRVYYGSDKASVAGRIESPTAGTTLGENPLVRVSVPNPDRVDRVDFLAYYEGFDENGDGVFTDWHHGYFYNRRVPPTPEDPKIAHHVGTGRKAPFEAVWDTRWVPDQPGGGVKLVARIRGKDGIWSVTPVVENLSLVREDAVVRLYKPLEVGERHWVRADRRVASKVRIPAGHDVGAAVEAALHVRTWNGQHEEFSFNGWMGDIAGGNHIYAYTVRPVPLDKLKPGENTIGFHSTTEHHGVEILWPGPALTVRYRKGAE